MQDKENKPFPEKELENVSGGEQLQTVIRICPFCNVNGVHDRYPRGRLSCGNCSYIYFE